jgi:quinol monooxygenase YgiN
VRLLGLDPDRGNPAAASLVGAAVSSSASLLHSFGEGAVTKLALYIPLQVKPGKEEDVADFLCSVLSFVNAEPGTMSCFAVREGSSQFAIFGTYKDEAKRDAFLNGKVTAALAAALVEEMEAGELFVGTPEIREIRILSHKQPH